MEEQNRIIVIFGALAAIVGFIIGSFVAVSRFQKDTYDCTVKCPDMNHSIQYNQICYCEIK
jgi:uncharacterized protein YneF (UPF0154 family)